MTILNYYKIKSKFVMTSKILLLSQGIPQDPRSSVLTKGILGTAPYVKKKTSQDLDDTDMYTTSEISV